MCMVVYRQYILSRGLPPIQANTPIKGQYNASLSESIDDNRPQFLSLAAASLKPVAFFFRKAESISQAESGQNQQEAVTEKGQQ